jgi:chitinase
MAEQENSFRVVAYLPTWQGGLTAWTDAIDLDKITHLFIAFMNAETDGAIHCEAPDREIDAVVKKCHERNIKVFMSIGGGSPPAGTTAFYQAMLKDRKKQDAFSRTLLEYMEARAIDGVDVDLEGSLVNAAYNDFVAGLAAIVKPAKSMTAALAVWNAANIADAALAQFDFINIMAYDMAGPWGAEGPHAPYEAAVSNLDYFEKERRIARHKLVLGLPFYGYDFGTGLGVSFKDIVRDNIAANPGIAYEDRFARIHYNGIPTIEKKTRLALGYGGVMIWEITQDCAGPLSQYSLLEAILRNRHL